MSMNLSSLTVRRVGVTEFQANRLVVLIICIRYKENRRQYTIGSYQADISAHAFLSNSTFSFMKIGNACP